MSTPENELPEFNNIAMSEVEVVFKAALKHSLGQYTGETKKEVISFFVSLGMTTNIHAALMRHNLESLVRTIFGEEKIRDFTMLLTASFLTRYGSATADYPVLANTLASALTAHGDEELAAKYNLVPHVYNARLPDREEIYNYLMANKWLMTYCLCVMYVNAATMAELA